LDLCFGEHLAAERGVRLISFDRPGYGGSSPAAFGLASIAADAHAVADELGVARFATLGMSGGGRRRWLLPQFRAAASSGRESPRAPGRSSWFLARLTSSMTATVPRCRCCRVIRPLRHPRSPLGSGRWLRWLARLVAAGWYRPLRICCPHATVSCCGSSDTPRRLRKRCTRHCAREPVALAGITSPGSGDGTSTRTPSAARFCCGTAATIASRRPCTDRGCQRTCPAHDSSCVTARGISGSMNTLARCLTL
jgi:alpha/beta hydrolase fold